MSLEDYNAVVRPKVQGTWNLHRHLPQDLDFFIMLSSVSGVVGNATQGAYAAGSTFLDSFAAYRNALGLPAVTIDLGVILGIGYLAANKELAQAMERQGFEGTDETLLMALMATGIQHPRRAGARAQTVTGLGRWREGESLGSLDLPLFAQFRRASLARAGGAGAEQADAAGALRRALRTATTLEEAAERITAALVAKIADRSALPAENIRPANPISDYGIDSLVAVEMRNWIAKDMDCTMPILELLANAPLAQLATKIARRSQLVVLDAAADQ